LTKLEEIARALHRSYHCNTIEGLSGGSAEAAWERDAAYGGNDEWLAQARAAAAVLREPSGDMIDAGAEAFEFIGMRPSLDGQPSKAWRAMVDAILNEAG
jgi:hypothetical protein